MICPKPWPNDRNISTQHIPTLLAQHLQAPAKLLHYFSTTYHNIVGHNMLLHMFGHPVAMLCDMLGFENQTSAHEWVQHFSNLAITMTITSCKIHKCCMKNLTSFKFEYPTSRDTSQQRGQTCSTCCTQHCWDILRLNVVIILPGLKDDFQSVVLRSLRTLMFINIINGWPDGMRIDVLC